MRLPRNCVSHDTEACACTLLHREFRDYSLGQVAFAVFQALLTITQLLCHQGVRHQLESRTSCLESGILPWNPESCT